MFGRKKETRKVMTETEMQQLIGGVNRSELHDHPVPYLKAVRATLLALGYDECWVEIDFREALERAYADELGIAEDTQLQ